MEEDFKKAAEFHGHICPGLAMGYRVAKYAKEHYPRSQDEELVCIAENRSCSVDAVQSLLGCTAGKGNLIVGYNENSWSYSRAGSHNIIVGKEPWLQLLWRFGNNIIHDHRGLIAVESEVGKGTSFKIHLPLKTGGIGVVQKQGPDIS